MALACISNAKAYEPPVHVTLSGFAVDLFNQCVEAENASYLKIAAQDKKVIGETDAGEDTYISNAPSRVTNWHFYNPYKEPVQWSWGVNRSMTGLVGRIEKRVEDSASFDPFVAGSALHFIEDVSVPAHVVPVFHGPHAPLLMYKHTGMLGLTSVLIHDGIDGWPVDEKRLAALIAEKVKDDTWRTQLLNLELVAPGGRYSLETGPVMYFVDSLAEQTLTALDENIPDSSCAWKTFWDHDYGHDYFKGYLQDWVPGSLGFGKPGQLAPGCELTSEKYNEFVWQRHLQAVITGASFLVYYRKMLRP
ncbi:hypothetical protein ACWJJH_02935 [Endozoicomonadaceae bacterium StTr2]